MRTNIDRIINNTSKYGLLFVLGDLYHYFLGYIITKIKFNSVGSRPYVWGNPVIHNFGKIIAGNNFKIHSFASRCSIGIAPGAKLIIKDHVFINNGCWIHSYNSINIGSNVKIGPYCILLSGDGHLNDYGLEESPEEITLEDNVWLGARTTVLKGVKIGSNSIIGAGSVITKDIPSNCMAAGNPAKVLKKII